MLCWPPNGRLEPVKGRAAAREHWFPKDQEWLPLTSFSLSIDDLGGCGNFAYVRGISNIGWEQDGKAVQAIGAYVTLLRKTSDGWRIKLQMWDSAK